MFAVDESGDPGLKVPTESRYFSLALISYDEDEVRELLSALRKQQGLPPHFEYHFAKGTSSSDRVRIEFMRVLASSGIRGSVVTMNKAAMPEELRRLSGPDVLADQLCSLLLRQSDAELNHATVLVDGRKRKKGGERLCIAAGKLFRRQIRAAGRTCRLEDIKPAESHRTDGIQVADMIVGSAQHAAKAQYGAKREVPDYLARVKHKVTIIRVP